MPLRSGNFLPCKVTARVLNWLEQFLKLLECHFHVFNDNIDSAGRDDLSFDRNGYAASSAKSIGIRSDTRWLGSLTLRTCVLARRSSTTTTAKYEDAKQHNVPPDAERHHDVTP